MREPHHSFVMAAVAISGAGVLMKYDLPVGGAALRGAVVLLGLAVAAVHAAKGVAVVRQR